MQKNVLRQRVIDRLAELKRGAVEVAEPVEGLERNYIRDLIEGKKESFNQAKLPFVAQALEWSVPELLGNETAIIKPQRDRKLFQVPLLDSVTAGKLRTPSTQIPVEDVPLLAFADLGRGEFFALRVEGDSMDRISPDGSVIVVNKADRSLINGKYYVFSVRGETTFKVWQSGDPAHLAPFSTNPLNKPVFFKRKDFEVIGRVKRTVLDL
jgi:SOS-response transcriptional repressor LexA